MDTPKSAAAKVVYYPVTAGHLSPEDLLAQFEKLGRNDPIWQAFMQILQRRLANATVAAVDREPNAAGRIEELLDIQRELMALRARPTKSKVRAI